MSYAETLRAIEANAGKSFNVNGVTINTPANGQWRSPAGIGAKHDRETEEAWAMGEQAYLAKGVEENDLYAKKALEMLNHHLSGGNY